MFGECSQSQNQTSDPSRRSLEITTNVDGNDAGIIDNRPKSISPERHKFMAEETDQHRAKSADGRRMQYVRDVYIDSEDNMAIIAIGFDVMSRRRSAFSTSPTAETSSGRTDVGLTYMGMDPSAFSMGIPRVHGGSQ